MTTGRGRSFLIGAPTLSGHLRSGELSPALEGHLAKYRKLVPALALINHIADVGQGDITEVSLLKALAFSKYLESHARRVYGASNTIELNAAQAILARIRKGDLCDGFTARDVHQHDWSGLTDRDHVHAGLSLLADLDYIAGSTDSGWPSWRATKNDLRHQSEGEAVNEYLTRLQALNLKKGLPRATVKTFKT